MPDREKREVFFDGRELDCSVEELKEKIASTVSHALVEVYPRLSDYTHKFLRGNQINICSVEEVNTIRTSDRPTDKNIFFSSLDETNITPDQLKGYFRFWDLPSYVSPSSANPILYVAKERGVDLEATPLNLRAFSVTLFAWELVQRNLEILPEPLEQKEKAFWRELARNSMQKQAEKILSRSPRVLDSKLEDAIVNSVTSSLDQSDTDFLATGAKVQVRHSVGDSDPRIQFEMGFDFAQGVNVFLAEPVERRTAELLVAKKMLPTRVLEAYETFRRGRLKNLPFLGNARVILRNLDLEQPKDILDSYFASTIPSLYSTYIGYNSIETNDSDPRIPKRIYILDYPD